ncbi:MAG: phosphatidate cytidylyltransferase, partial [Oscillospiraceae bacterium]
LNGRVLLLSVLIVVNAINMFLDVDRPMLYLLIILAIFSLLILNAAPEGTFRLGACATIIALTVTCGFRAMLDLRSMSSLLSDSRFLFFTGLAFGWICDTFAFTVGHLCGKHKLCEHISPNKTIEGAVGGVLGTAAFSALTCWLYASHAQSDSLFFGLSSARHIAFYAIAGAIGAVVGIFGDLAMSFVKRDCGIKDFGKLMPGHGGALDRMDSVLFTSVFARVAFDMFFKRA